MLADGFQEGGCNAAKAQFQKILLNCKSRCSQFFTDMSTIDDPESAFQVLRVISAGGKICETLDFEVLDHAALLLRSESPEVRQTACEAMEKIGHASSWYMDFILPLLTDTVPQVRLAAVRALGSFGVVSRDVAANKVAQLLKDPDDMVRCAALEALGSMQSVEHVAAMEHSLDDASPTVVASCCTALGKLGDKGEGKAGEIARKLDDKQTRHAALEALLLFGSAAAGKYAYEIVTSCLADPDVTTRRAAIKAVGQLSEAILANESALQRIIDQLQDQEAYARSAAALALGNLASRASAPVVKRFGNEILTLLTDDEEDQSWLAINLGGGLSRLPASLRKPKCAACVAFSLWEDYAFITITHMEKIAPLLSDKDWEVRQHALEALASMGDPVKEEASKVAALLKDNAFQVRAKACEALGKLRIASEVGSLLEVLKDLSPTVRASAVAALGNMGEEAVAPDDSKDASRNLHRICKLLDDSSSIVRAAAARSLGRLGSNAQCYAGILAGLLNSDTDCDVRCACLEALANMDKYGAAYSEDVADCLDDPSAPIRLSAVMSLAKMGAEAEPHAIKLKTLLRDSERQVAEAAQQAISSLEVRILSNFDEGEVGYDE